MRLPAFLTCLAVLASAASAQTGLFVEVPSSRAPGSVDTDKAVRDHARKVARLTEAVRKSLIKAGRYDRSIPFSLPTTVHLTQNNRVLRRQGPLAPGDITLVFDTSGSRIFPATYRQLLQDVFTAVKPTLDIVFGQASEAGPVLVKNYDADIGDRDAVAGGYFVPNNGSGGREIRFPVYVSPEATAVNFVHCLLLAYLGPNNYAFDGFQEGIVRAATMKAVRTTGALPATLDPNVVESALQNTYDVGSFYDWYNQRALGGPLFIAPNLRDLPLPAGGSLGGIYLLRYQMSGSAWQKLVAENPGFLREFNRRFYLNPTIRNDVAALAGIGQQALDTVTGIANATIEGFSFAEWVKRQFILESKVSLGQKLLVQPIPITTGLGGTDFGVFDVSATYFETQPGGNEALLSGTSFPIFWDHAFDRVFPSSQEERMDIAGAYGSVTPNIPDINSGVQYRCTIDIPVSDKIARAIVPVGSIATAANPTENNFYGTLSGSNLTGGTLSVRAFIGSTNLGTVPVRNFAFGTNYTQVAFAGYARLRVDILKGGNVIATRFVNKGPGPLALDLRTGEGPVNVPLLKGIQMWGAPSNPFVSGAGDLFNLPENQVLAARYDSALADYALYPDSGAIEQGGGYFVRSNVARTVTVEGRNPAMPIAVALKPGWNMVSNPLNENTTFNRIQVVRTAEFPKLFAEAANVDIDSTVFGFTRGPADAATGAPETGNYAAATSFEPGKAYFVRCLAPEGATLLFFPSANILRPANVPTPTGWRVGATITDSRSTVPVGFGRSNTATSVVDREDSLLPPRLVGGLYATMEVGRAELYRDVKHIGGREHFALRLEGLKPGTYYTIQLKPERGGTRKFMIRDYYEFVSTPVTVPGSFRFRATKTSHRLIITEAN